MEVIGVSIVYKIPIKNSLISRIKIYVPAGNFVESEKELGISHLLEHIFSEKKKKTGIRFNATTSNNNVIYDIFGDSKYFKDMIKIVKELFNVKNITEDSIKTAKKAVLEELLNHISNPLHVLLSEVYKNSYTGPKRYSYDIPKKIENLDLIKKNDIVHFFEKNYKNAVIVIYGYIGSEYIDSKKIIEHMLYKFGSGSGSSIIRKIPVKIPNQPKKNFIVVYKCFPIDYKNKCVYQSVISNILCGSLDSALYKKLRTSLGLIYEIFLKFEYSVKDNILLSMFSFSTSRDSGSDSSGDSGRDNGSNGMILDEFFDEMNNIKKGKFEFKNLIDNIVASESDNKNSSDMCDFFGYQLVTFGECIPKEEYIFKLKTVKKQKITELMNEFFCNDILVVES